MWSALCEVFFGLFQTETNQKGDHPMRTPNGPLFKGYEIAAIVIFAVAAVTLTAMQLVY